MGRFSVPALALVAALFDDPFYEAITVDFAAKPAERRRVLGLYFEYSLDEAQRTGRCVVSPDPEPGAAAWLLPRPAQAEAEESAAKTTYLSSILGPQGNESYHDIVRFMAGLAEQVVPADAWYLSIVGVLPSAQGRGLGARLLGTTLTDATEARAVCYVETFSPRNQSFYERLGFELVATHSEPTTRSRYALMRRGG